MKENIVMDFIINNWYIVIGVIVSVCIVFRMVYRFLGMPTEEQTEKVKQWLVWACVKAEKALQSGTGQLKLRQVYDMFCAVPAFTWVARLISFTQFSVWVSDALFEVKKMLINNRNLAEYVYGDNADEAIEKIKKQLEG